MKNLFSAIAADRWSGLRSVWDCVSVQIPRAFIALLLLALAHAPLLEPYWAAMWRYEHYQFLPFAYFAFFALWFRRFDRSLFQWSWVSNLSVAADVLLVWAGVYMNSPWMAACGLLFLFMAFLWASRDRRYGNRLVYLAVIPLLTIRLPLGMDQRLIDWLQEVTSRTSSSLLHWLGCMHSRDGNVIQLAEKALFVEESCSGIQSLFTVLLVAAVLAVLFRRSLLHTLLLLGGGVIGAVLMNVARVTLIAAALDFWSLDMSTGVAHQVLGFAILATTVLLLASTDQLLCFILAPVPIMPRPMEMLYDEEHRANPLTIAWNRLIARPPVPRGSLWEETAASVDSRDELQESSGREELGMVACSLVVGCLFVPQFASLHVTKEATERERVEGKRVAFQADSLLDSAALAAVQASANPIRLVNYEVEQRSQTSSAGQFSHVWTLQLGTAEARASCDYPYLSWHGVENCYGGRGWDVLDRRVVRHPEEAGAECVFVSLQKSTGERGYLVYSLFAPSGGFLTPPNRDGLKAITDRLAGRVERATNRRVPRAFLTDPKYQTQLFAESAIAWTDAQESEFIRLHWKTRQAMRDVVVAEDLRHDVRASGGSHVAE